MKKLMILAWMILFFAPFAWAQEKCEAPVWNVGDKWTYKDVNGATWTNEVRDIKEKLYIVKIGGIQDLLAFDGIIRGLYGFDKKTMNVKYVVEESGGRVIFTARWRTTLNFPIIVGKKWTEQTEVFNNMYGIWLTYFLEFKIEGIEEVTTAAGTFKAYKVYCKGSAAAVGKFFSDPTWWYRFWYSPEVKTWIKSEPGDKTTPRFPDAELISYQLN